MAYADLHLNLSGGTLTGALVAPTVTATTATIGGNYFSGNATGSLCTLGISPAVNISTYGMLGSTTLRWNTLWCGTVNYTLALTKPSDRRLKKNIVPHKGDCLAAIEGLGLCDYNLADESDGGATQLGVIAQEAREVAPGLVVEGADGLLGMNHDRLLYTLVGAIQQLSAKVRELESASQSAPRPLPRARSKKTNAADTPADTRL
jgi:hypothetical protein